MLEMLHPSIPPRLECMSRVLRGTLSSRHSSIRIATTNHLLQLLVDLIPQYSLAFALLVFDPVVQYPVVCGRECSPCPLGWSCRRHISHGPLRRPGSIPLQILKLAFSNRVQDVLERVPAIAGLVSAQRQMEVNDGYVRPRRCMFFRVIGNLDICVILKGRNLASITLIRVASAVTLINCSSHQTHL